MTAVIEHALPIDCAGETMIGVLSAPSPGCATSPPASRGVVVVVGGPQYRAGSHRQFTLLARGLAQAGTPVLRFDYRGMGDSEGAPRSFRQVGQDLNAAIDAFLSAQPGLQSVVLWGLCDGACAALFHAAADRRVSGVVLLNPWLRTEAGAARTQLRHYYTARLLAPDFWRKLLGGGVDLRAAAGGLGANLRMQMARKTATEAASRASAAVAPVAGAYAHPAAQPSADDTIEAPLPHAMAAAFAGFDGKILLILSGRDLTAKEFLDTVNASRAWRGLRDPKRVTRHDLAGADHTFSRRAWRDTVTAWTVSWMAAW